MSSQPSHAHAFAGLAPAFRPLREDELQADNDALVRAVAASREVRSTSARTVRS